MTFNPTTSFRTLIAGAVLSMLAFAACEPQSGGNVAGDSVNRNPNLTEPNSKYSYGFGYDMGQNMLSQDYKELDIEVFIAGYLDAVEEAEAKMSDQEIASARQEFRAELGRRRQAYAAKVGEENKAKGAEWLAQKMTEEGCKVTGSGLQYKIIEAGGDRKPKATESVTVNYRGTTIDGKEFDSSYKRGTPATFPLNRVISGWTEGLQLIGEGGKIELYIPSGLAYGERGSGANIPPNSALFFEVELIKIGG